jgi:hypothetical protein
MSKPDWENFAKAVLADWPTGDLEGSVLFDLSLQYGMIQEVPGGYNSDHHFDADGVCPEEGDPWYEYTFGGEAGPGLYSIQTLTEQLEAARGDAKEAEAYADELAGDQVDLCRQLIAAEDKLAECEARLGKAVEALNYCINAPFSGWTIAQGYARATLAEIEGEKG